MEVKIFLFSILFAITNANLLAPRDIVDDFNELLQELNSTVQGEIFVAQDDIDNMRSDFDTDSNNIMEAASLSLKVQQANTNSTLNSFKKLGIALDISMCMDEAEIILLGLPVQYDQQQSSCILGVEAHVDQIAVDARYTVDIIINKVNELEFRAIQCGENLLCLSPLLTEIELNKVQLPQNIRTEVQTFDGFLTTLKLSIEDCSNEAVTQYIAEAGALLGGIVECINNI